MLVNQAGLLVVIGIPIGLLFLLCTNDVLWGKNQFRYQPLVGAGDLEEVGSLTSKPFRSSRLSTEENRRLESFVDGTIDKSAPDLAGLAALKARRPSMKNKFPIHHIHIPKNSGSSLTMMLEKNKPPSKRFCNRCKQRKECIERFYSIKPEEFTPCDIISTHMPLGFPELFVKKKNFVQIVILRDPLRRAQSYYDYVKSSGPVHTNYEDVKVNSIGKILQRSKNLKGGQKERTSRHQLNFVNEQTWFLCGQKCDPSKMTLEAALHQARRNLLERCHFVGVQEDLQPFLDRLRSVYGWFPESFGRTNMHKVNHTQLLPADAEVAQELLWADISLHRLARDVARIDAAAEPAVAREGGEAVVAGATGQR